jgi:hypothetical protein
MRSIFAGMIMLSASMDVVDTAQAQSQPEGPPGYGSTQAPIVQRQPTQGDLQSTQDELEKIDKDNQLLNLPASQYDITGARPVPGSMVKSGTSAQAAGAPRMRFISGRGQSTTGSTTSPPKMN